jgi:hypothetical protein
MKPLWLTSDWFDAKIVQPIIRSVQSAKLEITDAIDDIGTGVLHDKRSRSLHVISIRLSGIRLTLKGEFTKMQCTDTQEFDFEFGKPLDKKGNPAPVQDGSVVLSVSDGNGTVTAKADNPFAGTFKADKPTADITAPGTVVINADADLGDGVKNITGAFPVIVKGGEAVGFAEPTIGAAREQA